MTRRPNAGVSSIRDARREMYRQQVLIAAEYLFARAGFDGARVDEIAATADVSLATLYKNFKSKGEIWNVLNTQRMNELVGAVRATTDEVSSPLEVLIVGVRTQVEFFAQHPNFLGLAIKEGSSWATATEVGRGGQRQTWQPGIDMLTRLAEAAGQAGELPDGVSPSIAAKLAVSSVQVWLTEWAEGGAKRPASVVADELAAHLRRSFGMAPDGSGSG